MVSPAHVRLRLAQAAFAHLPGVRVELDPWSRTVELLRGRPELDEPVVIVGADQLAAFTTWAEPDEVLRRARLAVADRPGIDDARIEAALAGVSRADRVARFATAAVAVSSSDVRARVARGEDVEGLVPAPVASLLRELELYRVAGAQ